MYKMGWCIPFEQGIILCSSAMDPFLFPGAEDPWHPAFVPMGSPSSARRTVACIYRRSWIISLYVFVVFSVNTKWFLCSHALVNSSIVTVSHCNTAGKSPLNIPALIIVNIVASLFCFLGSPERCNPTCWSAKGRASTCYSSKGLRCPGNSSWAALVVHVASTGLFERSVIGWCP